MARTGRPKGDKNLEYVCTIRLDDTTKKRLETYCKCLCKSKSEVIRLAIDNLGKETSYYEEMGCDDNKDGIN